jgi:hypothetical protein
VGYPWSRPNDKETSELYKLIIPIVRSTVLVLVILILIALVKGGGLLYIAVTRVINIYRSIKVYRYISVILIYKDKQWKNLSRI